MISSFLYKEITPPSHSNIKSPADTQGFANPSKSAKAEQPLPLPILRIERLQS